MTAQPIDLAAIPTPVTFPRAGWDSGKYPLHMYRFYVRDCTPLMRAWVVQEFSPFGEFTLPFGAANMTPEETERDAMLIAERMAVEEIRREVSVNEIRLLGEVVRDLVVAAIAKRNAERDLHEARTRELEREVL